MGEGSESGFHEVCDPWQLSPMVGTGGCALLRRGARNVRLPEADPTPKKDSDCYQSG